jgi:hypothetical protein
MGRPLQHQFGAEARPACNGGIPGNMKLQVLTVYHNAATPFCRAENGLIGTLRALFLVMKSNAAIGIILKRMMSTLKRSLV